MQFLIDYGLWSIPLLWILHEGGHWIACWLVCGRSLKFHWHFELLFVPVGTWYMPYGLNEHDKNIIYFWGFGLEFLAIPFLPWIYGVCAVIHFVTYPLRYGYFGEAKYWLKLLHIK